METLTLLVAAEEPMPLEILRELRVLRGSTAEFRFKVKEGQQVLAGQNVWGNEAMKMETEV